MGCSGGVKGTLVHPELTRIHLALHWLQTAEGRGAAHDLQLPHLLMPLSGPLGKPLWVFAVGIKVT